MKTLVHYTLYTVQCSQYPGDAAVPTLQPPLVDGGQASEATTVRHLESGGQGSGTESQ